MAYVIAYFIVNFIMMFKVIKNAYFTPHTPEFQKELRSEVSYYIPFMILFGTIVIVLEYYFRAEEGDL